MSPTPASPTSSIPAPVAPHPTPHPSGFVSAPQTAPTCSNAPQSAPNFTAPAPNEPRSTIPRLAGWREIMASVQAELAATAAAPYADPIPTRSPSPTLDFPSDPRPHRPARPLTPNQLRAARLLFAGHSTATIAHTLRIDRHTLARWKRRPDFQHELVNLLDATPPPLPQYNPQRPM